MEEMSFNAIKKDIHLKPFIIDITRKDIEYHKQYKGDKLTFYKDYKSKMIWFNCYGIGWDNAVYKRVINNKEYLIETDKTIIKIQLK